MKILFVVHAFLPNVGGSEYYVYHMAKEMQCRGHDVTVLAHNLNTYYEGRLTKYTYDNIPVTNDINDAFYMKWDAIIIHGADVYTQNLLHMNAKELKHYNDCVIYMLIKPSYSQFAMNGLKEHKWLAYSTSKDIEFIKKNNVAHKAVRVRHGIPMPEYIDVPKEDVYVSAGGFWRHKGFDELADAWEKSDITSQLHLYGYGEKQYQGRDTDKVKWVYGADKPAVEAAIRSAKGYIMNSYEEGFGLVLLEAMALKTPWFARKGVGAVDDLARYGYTYDNVGTLMNILYDIEKEPLGNDCSDMVNRAYEYVLANHTIKQTCNDLEDILKK